MDEIIKELQKVAKNKGFILLEESSWIKAIETISSQSQRLTDLRRSNNNLRLKVKDFQTNEITNLKARRDNLVKENKELSNKLKDFKLKV